MKRKAAFTIERFCECPMVSGVGIGFRRDIADELLEGSRFSPKFVELAPENWMDIGGRWGAVLQKIREKFDITTHGLSLSLGSVEPLDYEFLKRLRVFLDLYSIDTYTEHLSYCKCDNAHLYDLLPIPFRKDAISHVVGRIKEVQDILDRKICIENISYYTPVAPEISEAEFYSTIAKEADCNLLLDINNVYVNSFNHKYDAKEFIQSLPLERVKYIHMAGHEQESEDLIIDTHGQPIIEAVFDLLDWTLPKIKPVPILLERDFNFDELDELAGELVELQNIADKHWEQRDAA